MLCYEDLPDETDKRTLCLFAHFDRDNVVDPYVVYYLEALHRIGAAIVFVSASSNLSEESVAAIRGLCVGVFCNETPSRDFGSWHTAWGLLKDRVTAFDRIVFANDSVYGPMLPLEEIWESFHGADMYGAIESGEYVPHLQSWLLAYDINPKTMTFLNWFWNEFFRHTTDKGEQIWRYEIGQTLLARQAELTIKAFVSSDSADEAYRSAGGLLACENKTIDFWAGLINRFRFPFLKRVVAFRRPPHLAEFIQTQTDYPYELLESHRTRVTGVKV